MRYGYIVTEGPHDVEFIGRFLRMRKLKRIGNVRDLDSFWKDETNFIPEKFPLDGDLQRRMPVPLFFQNSQYSIALFGAQSNSGIAPTIIACLGNNELEDRLYGIGIVLDADHGKGAAKKKFNKLRKDLADTIALPSNAGEISDDGMRIGAFVFPDNKNAGTLETVLIKCAEIVYPDLYASAKTHIDSVDLDKLEKAEKKDFTKPSGNNKATIGCIGSVFKPGKAVQVSLQDNRWISDETLQVAELKLFDDFLCRLLDFEPIP